MPSNNNSNTDAWAIKLGGSLYNSNYLVKYLNAIRECSDKKIVIIPGGGPFADQVRLADEEYEIEPTHAHNMAILAMQQFGYLLASICPDFVLANNKEDIFRAWASSSVVIWEPYVMVRDQCTLDKSWDITSDSLAAWLTGVLNMKNLLLIKSSSVVLKTSELDILAKSECIDKRLPELINHFKINMHVLHKSDSCSLSKVLNSSCPV